MVSGIRNWSTTAGNNNATPPNGWPEGMAPSSVNNSARQGMADVRSWYEDFMWIDWGFTHTFVTSTQFRISGTNVTSNFVVGKRVRAVGSSTGTIYGTITVSSFSTDTTITVAWDSGSLSNETLQISVGMPSLGDPISINDVNIPTASIPLSAIISAQSQLQILNVRDEKSSGTGGQNSTAGSFITRDINTVKLNQISGASLASNQITLPAGTYLIYARPPGISCGVHRAKLRNITDGSDVIVGASASAAGADATSSDSIIVGVFTIAGSKVFEIQQRCSTSTTNGYGQASFTGLVEVYTEVLILKLV